MMMLYTATPLLQNRLETMVLTFHQLLENSTIASGLILCAPKEFTTLQKQHPQAKIFVLSVKPSFTEGSVLLQQGARGYGNAYMQKIHFMQALKTIENEAIWIYPEMMRELILLGAETTVGNETVLESLSAREKEVAHQIEKGLSNKEIATVLGITERTVKAHLSHVYEKLKVGDRLSLAMLLRK